MRIAGIETSASLIAQLALRLHTAGETALSWHVGRAVDHNLDEVDLSYRDCKDFVRVLKEPPTGLETLYLALQRECQRYEVKSTALTETLLGYQPASERLGAA